MKCPNCETELQDVTAGTIKCPNCEYECGIISIDYAKNTNHYCRLCGEVLAEGELSMCQRCFDKIKTNWRNLND